MIAWQEEFYCQEEAWTVEVGSLQASQEAINEEIEQARFELNANQVIIDGTRETIAKANPFSKPPKRSKMRC